ncbi:MAG: sulfurtransferase TusA family protein [Sneathiellaceae bacterium]
MTGAGGLTEAAKASLRRLDTTGHRCPIPVVRTEAALRALPRGAVLEVLADDPLAAVDIPHFCRQAGHDVIVERLPSGWRFLVSKAAA